MINCKKCGQPLGITGICHCDTDASIATKWSDLMSGMDETRQPVIELDRETEVRLALNALTRVLQQYTGDMYYECQFTYENVPPEQLQQIYDWTDKVTYFYKQCLAMEKLLHDRVIDIGSR